MKCTAIIHYYNVVFISRVQFLNRHIIPTYINTTISIWLPRKKHACYFVISCLTIKDFSRSLGYSVVGKRAKRLHIRRNSLIQTFVSSRVEYDSSYKFTIYEHLVISRPWR